MKEISYYELLGMIKEGNEPKEIALKLNCGVRTYIPEYDCGEFFLYKLKNKDLENENFKYYLADTLLESQMFDKYIEIIEPKKIEKLDYRDEAYIDSAIERIFFVKINEIIDYLNEKEDR